MRTFAFLLFSSVLWGQFVYPPGQTVQAGVLPDRWATGGPRCLEAAEWQVHEYNEDFYILRESGCTHYEKPFLYLIFGGEKALLVDSGAGDVDVARIVTRTMKSWQRRKQRTAPLPLLVMHSHAHGDHVAGDKQLAALPDVTVIPATPAALEKAFGISPYPTEAGFVDLGGRPVDILAIPGHEAAAVAVYDRQTGILLTGDTFYPGRLSVADWPAYEASAQRLVDFIQRKVVTHILGAHIEQTRTPYADYPRGTLYQPEEHALALSPGDLLEWHEAIRQAKGIPGIIARRSFTIIARRSFAPPAQTNP